MKDLLILFIAFLLFLFLTTSKVYSQIHYYITSSDQTELYVQEFGTGEPLILLAGGPLNASYMKSVWENLNKISLYSIRPERNWKIFTSSG